MEKNERQGLAFFAPFELSALQIGVQRVEKSGSHEPPLTLVFRNVQLCRRSITALPSIPQEHTRFHLRYNKIPLYSILKSYALQLCTIYIVMPVIFWYNFTISSGNYNQKRSVLAMQKKLKKFFCLLSDECDCIIHTLSSHIMSPCVVRRRLSTGNASFVNIQLNRS